MNERYELIKKAMRRVRSKFAITALSHGNCCMSCTTHNIKGSEYIFAKLYRSGGNASDFSLDKTFDTVYLAWGLSVEKLVGVCEFLQDILEGHAKVIIPEHDSQCIKLVFKKEEQTHGNV